MTLNIANLYGYIKCKGGNQENLNISTMASSFIFQNIGKVRTYLKYSLEKNQFFSITLTYNIIELYYNPKLLFFFNEYYKSTICFPNFYIL